MPELESEFAQALLSPDRSPPGGVTTHLGGVADHRFAIYRNNVIVGLVDALAESFPAVQRITGEEFFRAASAEFVRARPPVSPVLLTFGNDFADFLETFPPAASVPYLADVARLEFAWIESFHAADCDPMDAAVLGAIPPQSLGGLRLELHPSLRLVVSSWPVVAIWEANQSGCETQSLELPESSQCALVCRPRANVMVTPVTFAGGHFIQGLRNGLTLLQAATQAQQNDAEFDLAHTLGKLIEAGALAGLVSQQNTPSDPPTENTDE